MKKSGGCVEAQLQIAVQVLPCCWNQDGFTAPRNLNNQKYFIWFLHSLSNLRHTRPIAHTHTHERMSALRYLRLRDLFKDSRRFCQSGGWRGRWWTPPFIPSSEKRYGRDKNIIDQRGTFVTVLRVPCTSVKVWWHIHCSGRCCHPENHIQPLDAPPFTRIVSLGLQTWLPGRISTSIAFM